MAVLRTIAEIEAAGAALPREQGWPPRTQAQVDHVAAILTAARARRAQAASHAA